MTPANNQTQAMIQRFASRGINVTWGDACTLRRASLTLVRWNEQKCGDGNDYASWAIERDDAGRAYRVTYPHTGKSYRRAIPDRERGALARVAEVCSRLGLHYYHQTDPRGCALYVGNKPLNDQNYSAAVACY